MDSISVVMATNRINKHLDQAVASVFANENLDLELVLVLDGILLPDIIPTWANDARVKIVKRETSHGLAAALNTGIKAATYDIIARLDADDISIASRFVNQLRALNSFSKPALVGSRMELIDESGSALGISKQPCGPDVRTTLLLQNVVPHSSYLFKKADAFSVGLYREQLKQMEDYDFLLRMAKLGPINVLCEPLIQYRVHPEQMSKSANYKGDYIEAVITGRHALGKHLGVSPIKIWIQNLLWRLAQALRSLGLTQPWHLRGIPRQKDENQR